MNTLDLLLINKVLVAAFTGWALAQLIKTIIHLIISGKFVMERLVGSGGMPSAHSATVCALTTASFIEYGADSFQFALALIFAFVVMYDAIGVRREAGNHAEMLNGLMEMFARLEDKNICPEDKLKEFIGHTPIQVFVGAILGIIIAIFIC
ncbi:MAG: divergent PAP2 family protein [Peptostreptococcaceae bacterium]|nr:divergent PAP2 family protein [Peptostreptococcaceae bacterium]